MLSSPNARWWGRFMMVLVGLGIAIRIANLAQPVYWVDEVATSMRVSGYTQAEVKAQVATAEPISGRDLQYFQRIRTDRPRTDLLRVLSQSPEHTPLYFILVRFWAELWSTSAAAMRSLSVVFGVLTLPAMYGLGRSLMTVRSGTGSGTGSETDFETVTGTGVGEFAMGLLAISPFFIAYSQEARPYSLWTLLLLLTSQWLLRSLQSNRWQSWLLYSLCLGLTFYTSLLTALLVVGQGVAVLLFYRDRWRGYGLATGGALLSLLPWIWVVLTGWQTLQNNTQWTQVPIPVWEILGTWFYSLAVVFFDVPVALHPVMLGLQIAIASMTVGLLLTGMVVMVRRAPRTVWGFVLAGAWANPVLLLLLDVARNGQSTAPRYLIPVQLGALIAVAYWLGQTGDKPGDKHPEKVPRSRLLFSTVRTMVLGFLLAMSLLSAAMIQPSPYLKSRNLSNAELAARLNLEDNPQLISTPHHIQDLISLSYDLDTDIRFYILPSEEDSPRSLLYEQIDPTRPIFWFGPSAAAREQIMTQNWGVWESVYQPPALITGRFPLSLWQLELSPELAGQLIEKRAGQAHTP
ncbi:MAG: glycosyltransferase family 39 protein [Cyanobacteria bacterium J06634_5]